MTGRSVGPLPGGPVIVHATCVAVDGRAVLLRGGSGAGKSGTAIDMLSRGASLVSDDRTTLARIGDAIVASPPPAIAGRIEARGFGLLRVDHVPSARVHLVVDLTLRPDGRLPRARDCDIMGVALPLSAGAGVSHLGAVLMLALRRDDALCRDD
ncbi:HPr kinase [Oceaniovalibus guishaninsula JLT2003]|uniref:HPr kinase n=1 Tax=Oceaniovalibus guishaninsula JLT2003 TaxID=1231392 RepID=K2GPY8_9RHOB|nr:HPr kinase [Oceaniovalibus guishaninsula]EKE44711.1 HPr kinase [Oceaniovalibus guishaninsula JLT2003]